MRAGFLLSSSTISFFPSLTLTLCQLKSIISLLLISFVLFAAFAIISQFFGCGFTSLSLFVFFDLWDAKTWLQIVRLTMFDTLTQIRPWSGIALSSLATLPNSLKYVLAISSPYFQDITSKLCCLSSQVSSFSFFFLEDIGWKFVLELNSNLRYQI